MSVGGKFHLIGIFWNVIKIFSTNLLALRVVIGVVNVYNIKLGSPFSLQDTHFQIYIFTVVTNSYLFSHFRDKF